MENPSERSKTSEDMGQGGRFQVPLTTNQQPQTLCSEPSPDTQREHDSGALFRVGICVDREVRKVAGKRRYAIYSAIVLLSSGFPGRLETAAGFGLDVREVGVAEA